MNQNTKQALEKMIMYIGNLPNKDPRHFSGISLGHRSLKRIVKPNMDFVKVIGKNFRGYKKGTRKNIWDSIIFPEFYSSTMPILANDSSDIDIKIYNYIFPFRSGIKITDDTKSYFKAHSGLIFRNSISAYLHKE